MCLSMAEWNDHGETPPACKPASRTDDRQDESEGGSERLVGTDDKILEHERALPSRHVNASS